MSDCCKCNCHHDDEPTTPSIVEEVAGAIAASDVGLIPGDVSYTPNAEAALAVVCRQMRKARLSDFGVAEVLGVSMEQVRKWAES